MSPDQIKLFIVAVLGASFIINLITRILSASKVSKPLPDELSDVYESESQHLTAVRYVLTNVYFGITTSSIGLIGMIYFISIDGFALIDNYLTNANVYPMLKPVWFFAILFFATDILQIPFQLYAQFSIEERFGFNKMTLKLFFIDKIKSWLVMAILGGSILFILFWLLNTFKENYWYYFWAVLSVYTILINFLYTTVFVPLFNKLTPLEDGEIKEAILSYAKEVEISVEDVYVIDGSKRSTKANAFFAGFGKLKKIVLYDTLIDNLTTEEIVAVLAHEAGHLKRRHIIYNMLIGIVQTGAILYISSWILFSPRLSQALGVETLSLHINLIVFGFLFSPISGLIGVLMNVLHRKNEYEADAFAVETFGAEPLISALKKLGKNNFSNLTPHPIDLFLNYSHPTMLQRIRSMYELEAEWEEEEEEEYEEL